MSSRYYAQAVSRKDLRELAYVIRSEYGYIDSWYLPIELLLDQLCIDDPNLSYEIVPDKEWEDPSTHAETDVINSTIRIKESVYEGACNYRGRDRMTIAHEISHYILVCVLGLKLYSRSSKTIKTFNDPEWQAKCLAAELLIPYHKLKNRKKNFTPDQIAFLCRVSNDAATYQLQFLIGG